MSPQQKKKMVNTLLIIITTLVMGLFGAIYSFGMKAEAINGLRKANEKQERTNERIEDKMDDGFKEVKESIQMLHQEIQEM